MKRTLAKRWMIILWSLGLQVNLAQAAFVQEDLPVPDSVLAQAFQGRHGNRWAGIQPLYATMKDWTQKAGGRRLAPYQGHAVGWADFLPPGTPGFYSIYSIYPGAGFALRNPGANLSSYPGLDYGKQVDFSSLRSGVNWGRNAVLLRPEDFANASLVRAYLLWGRSHSPSWRALGARTSTGGGSAPVVPEPATFYAALLMLAPLGGSAWRVWRRRRSLQG
ncbi:MAG TPA: hypothetical protein VNT26_24175 [Candidatus Sulfotelmatobacter sp.]|nr:hypothetical protein [Candidatus Sulfotelmatobacter sp.]